MTIVIKKMRRLTACWPGQSRPFRKIGGIIMPILKTQVGQKTAFLTGASGGIGRAAAAALTNAGYRVIGTSRRAAPPTR
jgi:NADPH:quinone reductase-like Zn-dependent oxidoreductase